MSYRCGPVDWIDLAVGRLEDAHGVLNAIEGKEADKVDDEEVLCFCHDLAVVMTTLETVAMIGRLVPWFLGDKGCEGE